MKKIMYAAAVAAMGAMLTAAPALAESAVKIVINGEPVVFTEESGEAFIDENSRSLVPLRVTMETAGLTVGWDNAAKTAVVVSENGRIEVPIGTNLVYCNGEAIENDTQAVIKDSRTYLPIRAVLEAAGFTVNWNNEERTVEAVNEAGANTPVAYTGEDINTALYTSAAQSAEQEPLLIAAPADNTAEETQVIELGSTGIFVKIPGRYHTDSIEMDEDQVAYYRAGDTEVDFDVYQFARERYTLEDYMRDEAAEYESKHFTTLKINNIPVAFYEAQEKFNDEEYTTMNYTIASGDQFAEIVFWLDDENSRAVVASIMETLSVAQPANLSTKNIELGNSRLYLQVPNDYVKDTVNDEMDVDQLAYYRAGIKDIDFDVYQFAKKENLPLEDFAKAEVEKYNGTELKMETINKIPVASYQATREYNGEEFLTCNYVMEAGTKYIAIVFWLDDEITAGNVLSIMNTLSAKD